MNDPPPNPPHDEDERPTIPIHQLATWIVEGPDRDPGTILEVGEALDGRYNILEVRGGRGLTGMGVIYIVEEAGRFFAVKTFQAQHARDLGFIQRFIREVETWMLTGFHQNIVRPYKLEIIDALPYLFMEFVPSDADGRHTLGDYLRHGPLPMQQTLTHARQVCAGMCHATRAVPGLVHRDLKPANLLVDPDGVLKITDFGLVRAGAEAPGSLSAHARDGQRGATNLTRAGSTFGTPAYMAPEQFRAPEQVTTAADIYAFGCCLYEMMTGSPPFTTRPGGTRTTLQDLRNKHEKETPAPLLGRVRGCTPEIERLVLRCLEKQPDQRWQSFAAIAQHMDDHIDTPAPSAPSEEPGPREVADQMQSLTLLEGYQKAIALNEVREHHVAGPYDLHLALASYFHCTGNDLEETRQLERACRNTTGIEGYEAVRRLADRLLYNGSVEEAHILLAAFLKAFPESEDHVLEPLVRLDATRGEFQAARKRLDTCPDTPRSRFLRMEVLETAGAVEEVARELEALLAHLHKQISRKIAGIDQDAPSGWEDRRDPDLLAQAIRLLEWEIDTAPLAELTVTTWPDLTGYPDFSAEMAWLSEVLGKMAGNSALNKARRHTARAGANMLGFPERLNRHNERDEYWFWLQQIRSSEGES